MSSQPNPLSPSSPADPMSAFYGANAGYVVEQYERFLRDPESVDPATRAWFATWSPGEILDEAEPSPAIAPLTVEIIAGATALARSIRAYGHLAAPVDPLGTPPPGDPSLELSTHGLTPTDLFHLPAHIVGGPSAPGAANAAVAIERLREVYCGMTGYEFRHVQSHAERVWLRDVVEGGRFREPHEPIDGRRLLQQLTEVEAFETFLQQAFPGQKRFSIEGLDVLLPMLLEFIGCAAEDGVRSTWLGMAHRGRLSILARLLGKPVGEIFAEMSHTRPEASISPTEREDHGWTGDVTYHLGARTAYDNGRAVEMLVTLAPNPSHLEFVDPVVEGMCRAASEQRDLAGPPRQDVDQSIVVLIHGDAAFAGEGVVAETLNLSRLAGYQTGGTIHIIENNQLGFTTPPASGRSTLYASDLAKGFEIPIVHVNADDPEACIEATRLAHAYRQLFHKDFLIDLVGYRRWGHNEGDEPTFTQPRMYARVKSHPTARAIWAAKLIDRREVTNAEAEHLLRAETASLQATFSAHGAQPTHVPGSAPHQSTDDEAVVTAVSANQLKTLNLRLNALPTGFALNPKLGRWIDRRRGALDDAGSIDWAQAEALAFASLLAQGTPIRLTGQDTARGTFSQRHLVLRDVQTGQSHIPLQALPEARASFVVYDSPLAEIAPLGFEYGYSIQAPDTLVLWEAQFGDFANAAQVTIDQFVAAGQAKWGQTSSLVLLLPHGLEGQGPEHSSARIERYLQLAAQDNLQIVNCTTAAQYFHLLRRQAGLLVRRPRPLIVFTPKSLLRHPLAASEVGDLTRGTFQLVIDDASTAKRVDRVTRVILCSGHVYVDLLGSPSRETDASVAIVRVEQLYPFPREAIGDILGRYPKLQEICWIQEEPANMGAWSFAAPMLAELMPAGISLSYIGRTSRASPAVGPHHTYNEEQAALVGAAYGQIDSDLSAHGVEVLNGVEHGSRHSRPASRRIPGRSDRRTVAQTRG